MFKSTKNLIKKYGFIGCTTFNTGYALYAIGSLFTAAATPLTAFLAVTMSIVAIGGWVTISYSNFERNYEENNKKAVNSKTISGSF